MNKFGLVLVGTLAGLALSEFGRMVIEKAREIKEEQEVEE